MPSYAVDGIVPRTVLLPLSEEEVAFALRAAAEEGSVVVPWGAGSQQDLGNPLERIDAVLSLERLNHVVEYVPADMTITVQAGMRFSDLQALTALQGQTVPLDPARAAHATIGGIVATAAAGPRHMAYGRVRDLVLGVRLALPNGRVIKAGGKVVKNVAGYDLPKLAIGSLGTLGVITEVSLRLRPLPADSRTVLFGFAALDEALAAAETILNSELLPAAVTLLAPAAARRLEAPGPVSMAVALEETLENNAYQVKRLTSLTQNATGSQALTGENESAFWDRLTNYGDHFGTTYCLRVNTVLSDLPHQLAEPNLEAIAHVGSATVLLYGQAGGAGIVGAISARFAAARTASGSAVLESAPLALRRQVDVWGPPRPEWKFTRELKKAFDPAGILNRGRYVGGI